MDGRGRPGLAGKDRRAHLTDPKARVTIGALKNRLLAVDRWRFWQSEFEIQPVAGSRDGTARSISRLRLGPGRFMGRQEDVDVVERPDKARLTGWGEFLVREGAAIRWR